MQCLDSNNSLILQIISMSCKRSAYGTPHTLTTTLFTVVSVLCTILLDHSHCSPCTRTFESTVKFKNVRRDVNTGIVTSTHVTLSATQCSYKCTRNSSVSFYYAANRRDVFNDAFDMSELLQNI